MKVNRPLANRCMGYKLTSWDRSRGGHRSEQFEMVQGAGTRGKSVCEKGVRAGFRTRGRREAPG